MNQPTIKQCLDEARALRQARRIDDSQRLIDRALTAPAQQLTRWLHGAVFWQPLQARHCRLVRRSGADVEFVRRLWSDAAFMRRFHRLAGPLPADDTRLHAILESEFVALLTDMHSLHWVIQDDIGHRHGVLSLTGISLPHRRAEVLIGVLPGAPFGLATAAMLLLFRFVFDTLGFNKLHTLNFTDNAHSFDGTRHLGFQLEGVLRRHVFDPLLSEFADLRQTSLLREEAFSAGNLRLMQRLGVPPTVAPAWCLPAAAVSGG